MGGVGLAAAARNHGVAPGLPDVLFYLVGGQFDGWCPAAGDGHR